MGEKLQYGRPLGCGAEPIGAVMLKPLRGFNMGESDQGAPRGNRKLRGRQHLVFGNKIFARVSNQLGVRWVVNCFYTHHLVCHVLVVGVDVFNELQFCLGRAHYQNLLGTIEGFNDGVVVIFVFCMAT